MPQGGHLSAFFSLRSGLQFPVVAQTGKAVSGRLSFQHFIVLRLRHSIPHSNPAQAGRRIRTPKACARSQRPKFPKRLACTIRLALWKPHGRDATLPNGNSAAAFD